MREWQPLSWPDKIGIIAASAVAVLGGSLGALLLASVGSIHVPRLENAIVRWTIYAELATALPLWLFLRGVNALRTYRHRLRAGKPAHIPVGALQFRRAPRGRRVRNLRE